MCITYVQLKKIKMKKNELIFNPKTVELELSNNSNENVNKKENELVFDPSTGDLIANTDETITDIAENGFAGCHVTSYDVVKFLDWININYPNLNKNKITKSKIKELLNEYDSLIKYEDIERDNYLLYFLKRKLFKSRLIRSSSKMNILSFFRRYNQIKYHGLFLFSQMHNEIQAFLIHNWSELDSLTDNHLDIYFSKKDTKKKTGTDILKSFGFPDDKDVIIPSFILWDDKIQNAITFELTNFNEIDLFNLLQRIIIQIRKGNTQKIIYENIVSEFYQNFMYKVNVININGNKNTVIQEAKNTTIKL